MRNKLSTAILLGLTLSTCAFAEQQVQKNSYWIDGRGRVHYVQADSKINSTKIVSTVTDYAKKAIKIVAPNHESKKTPHQAQALYWIDPKAPHVHYAGPGLSRTGTKLIPIYSHKHYPA